MECVTFVEQMKSKINIEFGNRIVELRKKAGLTQDELAFRSNIHRAYMGTIERGEKSVTLNTIEKIAAGLDVNVKDLFNWD